MRILPILGAIIVCGCSALPSLIGGANCAALSAVQCSQQDTVSFDKCMQAESIMCLALLGNTITPVVEEYVHTCVAGAADYTYIGECLAAPVAE